MLVHLDRLYWLTAMLSRALHLDFSRKDYAGPPIKELIDVINYVKPTALFGLSTVKVCWDVKRSVSRARIDAPSRRMHSTERWSCAWPS